MLWSKRKFSALTFKEIDHNVVQWVRKINNRNLGLGGLRFPIRFLINHSRHWVAEVKFSTLLICLKFYLLWVVLLQSHPPGIINCLHKLINYSIMLNAYYHFETSAERALGEFENCVREKQLYRNGAILHIKSWRIFKLFKFLSNLYHATMYT